MKIFQKFRDDESGNFAMMFGLALVPILGLVGAAVDYARASKARTELAAALDDAALMAARDASKLTDGQLRTRINEWVKANLSSETAAQFSTANIAIDRVARTVTVGGALNVDTTVARVIGTNLIEVGAQSQSSWGTKTIELALALDNTGSMASSGKMAALKTATRELLRTMKDASAGGDQIRISMIPFATQVRLPQSYNDAPWLKFTETRETGNGNNKKTETITKGSWEGCVSDRDLGFDFKDGDTNGNNDTRYPADFCKATSLARLLPLTNNWADLNEKVDQMTPSGNTNVTIGVSWGWASLSQALPLDEAKDYGTPRLSKYMIVLTDGLNTENRFTKNGNAIDARTGLACKEAKKAGIQIYTVRVIDGDANLLRDCATDPSMYYDVKNASQLTPVFQKIAAEISAVRLTQ